MRQESFCGTGQSSSSMLPAAESYYFLLALHTIISEGGFSMWIGGGSPLPSWGPGNDSNWMLILTALVLIAAIAVKLKGWA